MWEQLKALAEQEGKEREERSKIRCPCCGGEHYTVYGKKFSKGAAVAGAIVFGPIGLLAGRTNKVQFICLTCGKKWTK